MTASKYQAVAELLNAIEFRLREIGAWSEERPAAEALASTLPFCYDTLELESWIQFIFIGRMRELLEQGDPLPETCGISPYIEMLAASGRRTDQALVELIEAVDRAVSL